MPSWRFEELMADLRRREADRARAGTNAAGDVGANTLPPLDLTEDFYVTDNLVELRAGRRIDEWPDWPTELDVLHDCGCCERFSVIGKYINHVELTTCDKDANCVYNFKRSQQAGYTHLAGLLG